jgi:hypothetical protein
MRVDEYYRTISEASKTIFEKSVAHCDFLGKVHDYSTSIQEWIDVISPSQERLMIDHSVEQLEFSCLFLLSGMYRQSFSSLRLALELLFGGVYFSAHKLEYLEWSKGSRDLNWNTISDVENGVLSKRFSDAFFPELSNDVEIQRIESKKIYRQLSEFVHGNYSTWNRAKPSLSINEKLIKEYKEKIYSMSYMSHFLLSMRYLKELQVDNLHKVEIHVMDELQHIDAIRSVFGGAVEDK